MSIEYKILFKADMPEEFENSLGSYVSSNPESGEHYIFTHGGEGENLIFSPVDWDRVKQSNFAFIDNHILRSEVAQLIMRRAAGNIGALNIDDLKDDLIEKSYTVKILNEYSLGHISDIVLNFAAEREVNAILIRPYVINLLNFFTALARAKVVSFPIDLDCGFSSDTFFIQAHCRNNEFVMENILDTLKEGPVGGVSGQFEDILKYTDLLNIFTIKSSKKLIFTGCWFYQGVWTEKKRSYPSLIVHDVPSLSLESEDLDNSVNSFIKHSLDNISKIKISEASIAEKYKIKRDNEVVEAINPVKLKTLYDFLEDKVSLPVDEEFNVESLDEILKSYPNTTKVSSINKEEKKELVKLLKDADSYKNLDDDVQKVKGQISKDDYISQMIQNISDMSVDDVKTVFDPNSSVKEEATRVSGKKEDLTQSRTRVAGTKEDLTEASTRVAGTKEDLTQAITRVAGSKEDLTEAVTRVKGSIENEKEQVEIVKGRPERISEGSMKVKSLGTEVTETAPELQVDSAEHAISQEEIREKVKASNPTAMTNKDVTRIAGENTLQNDNEVWEVKRLNVIKKMKSELESSENLTPEQVNKKVESILQSELGVEIDKSKEFVNHCSDDIAEKWVAKGVDNINNEITQRLRMEKIENQLATRDRQVDKMKELITKLKLENGNLQNQVRGLEKENKAADFKLRRGDEELKKTNLSPSNTSSDETTQMNSPQIDSSGLGPSEEVLKQLNTLKSENENLKGQIDTLKKRVSFMYENSKANAGTNLDTNDIQSMADENERLKNVVSDQRSEFEKLKAEKRELEQQVGRKNNELQVKEELLSKSLAANDSKSAVKAANEISSLNETIKTLHQENKDAILKAKSFEQKLKYVNVQLDRYKKQEKKASSSKSSGGATDLKVKAQIKNLETMSEKMKQSLSKAQKELAEKKTELHKAKLKNKTMAVKLRDLEKKLDVLGRKAS